jgi:SAM-dependent methyltransferase
MWLDFALTSVGRGRDAVRRMGGRKVFEGRDVLDVGCAYGGFLVAAKEAGAASVAGIDIDPGLLDLARLLLADYEVEATLEHADVTDKGIERRLGTFDLVFCNDVLEHVVDPIACVENLSALLRPGGMVFLEIPNAMSVDFMLSDGHYGLAGITLLDRADAEVWWQRHFGGKESYGVELFAPVDYYLSILSGAGLYVRQLNPPGEQELEGVVGRLAGRFDQVDAALAKLDDGGPVAAMRQRADEERAFYDGVKRRYDVSTVAPERSVMARTLVNRYERQFWTLVAMKPGLSAGV